MSSATPNPGQWTSPTATVTLTNAGTQSVGGVRVALDLPADVVFQGGNEATASQGTFSPYTAPQVWTVGTLAAGASATLECNLFYMTTGARSLVAHVSAQGTPDVDSQAGNGFGNGEDDESCFEFRGAGACPSNGGGNGGGGTGGGNVPAGFAAEAGSVSVSQADGNQWTPITFQGAYTDPIVVAHLNTSNGGEYAHVRLRNVSGGGCEVQIEEWEYLDGGHATETVSYVVVEAGTYDLGGGRVWVAGRRSVGASWAAVAGAPSGTYAAFATAATTNDARACVVRQRRTNGQLELRLQQEEALPNDHAAEQVHYLLVTEGTGTLDGDRWRAAYGADELTGVDRAFTYAGAFGSTPALLADLQTYDGGDPAYLRTKNPSASGFTGFCEEETSADPEVNHTTERGGYFAVAPGVWGASTTAALRSGDFYAEPTGRRVETYWPVAAGAAAAGVDRYEVERLGPGGSWELLGAAGAHGGRVARVFDEAPAYGDNVYRLRTLRTDGTYLLSRERTVRFAIDREAIAIFPNPTADYFTVVVPRITEHAVDIQVVNTLGQVVLARRLVDRADDRAYVPHRIPAGHYRVYVTVGGVREGYGLVVAE